LQAGKPGAWQVLIVEDDPRIATDYRKTVSAVSRLEVAGVVTSGEQALDFMRRHPCDLLLLDLHLAGMDGVTLLQHLRSSGNPVEVIALTATRSTKVVRTMVQRGAIEYLVKPFTVERLRQSLGLFLNRAAAMHSEELDQDAVDRVCAAGRVPRRWLPKGLTEDGVMRVRRALQDQPSSCSSTEVAEQAGLARVTARRYLEYLVATDQASVEALPCGPGRPRKLYRWTAA